MNSHLVTIAIPTYNRAEYVSQAILSGINQTYKNIEIVVVDNNSTDATWDVISNIAKNHQNVKVFRNETNIGPVNNWIKALTLAHGKYVNLLFSDDLISSTFVEKLLPSLTSPDVGFSFSGATIFNDSISPMNGTPWYNEVETGYYSCQDFIDYSMLFSPCKKLANSPACTLFRRDDILDCLMANIPNKINSDFSSHAIGNDLLIFLLVAKRYQRFSIINEPLTHFRAHPDSITIKSNSKFLNLNYTIAKSYFFKHHMNNPKNSKFIEMLNSYINSGEYMEQGIVAVDDFFD